MNIHRGWVISLSTVEQVQVSIDNQSLGNATIGLPRDDVRDPFPDYPGSANAGFLLQLDVTGKHFRNCKLQVAANTIDGSHHETSAVITDGGSTV